MNFKKWYLKNGVGEIVKPLLSLRMTHNEGLPATLEWEVVSSQNMKEGEYTLWCEDLLFFRGFLWKAPLKRSAGSITWYAIAMDEKTYGRDWRILKEELEMGLKLKGPKDIIGPHVGSFYIHPVTHEVSWISYLRPREVVAIKDFPELVPLSRPLRGIRGEVIKTSEAIASGVMDTSQHLEGLLNGPIKTNNEKALKKKWKQLAFKFVQSGYDPQKLDFEKGENSLLRPQMVLGWNQRVCRKNKLQLEVGRSEFELMEFSLLDQKAEDKDILDEMKVWMKSYSAQRSFLATGSVECWMEGNIEDISLTKWLSCPHPAHPLMKISGPITKIELRIKYGFTIATFHFKWAPEEPFKVDGSVKKENDGGDRWCEPNHPGDIIAWAKKSEDDIELGVRSLPLVAQEQLETTFTLV